MVRAREAEIEKYPSILLYAAIAEQNLDLSQAPSTNK